LSIWDGPFKRTSSHPPRDPEEQFLKLNELYAGDINAGDLGYTLVNFGLIDHILKHTFWNGS